MIFTQEQIKELKQRLSLVGIKDTEFDKAEPLTGHESVAIVQEGENRLLPIMALRQIGGFTPGEDQPVITTITTDQVWDVNYEMTQEQINKILLGAAMSVTLSLTGMNRTVEKGSTGSPVLKAKASYNKATVKIYRSVSGSVMQLAEGTGEVEYRDSGRIFNSNTVYYAVAEMGNISKESSRISITVTEPTQDSYFYWGLIPEEEFDISDLEAMVDFLENEEEIPGGIISNKNISVDFSGDISNHDDWRYVMVAIPSGISVRNFYMNNFSWDYIALIGTVVSNGKEYNVYSTDTSIKPSTFIMTINKS